MIRRGGLASLRGPPAPPPGPGASASSHPGDRALGVYDRMLRAADPGLAVFMQACPLLVPLAENGRVHPGDIVAETVVREYLAPIKAQDVDTLILACTHYPLLSAVIAAEMGPSVTLIDSGAAAAESVRGMLVPAGRHKGKTRYFVSDGPGGF